MHIEVDQSGKIEMLSHDTVIACSNKKQYCIKITKKIKQELFYNYKRKIKQKENVQSLNEKTGKIVSKKVNTLLDTGNKTIFEVKTASGRNINTRENRRFSVNVEIQRISGFPKTKSFRGSWKSMISMTTGNHHYLTIIHDKEKCEEYLNNGFNNYIPEEYTQSNSCLRWVEVKNLKENDEIAVPKSNYNPSNSANSLVLNTLIRDCCLNASSSDQIGELNTNAKAKYGSSLVTCSPCGEILLALERNSLYSSPLNVSISLLSSERMSLNSSSSILANFIISDLLFDNSSKTKLGDTNLHSCSSNFLNTSLLADEALNNENRMEASTIISLGNSNNICNYNPCLFATFLFNLSASLSANSSVILLSFNTSSNLLNASSLLSLSRNASLATSLQLIHENLFNSDLMLSDMVNVTVDIYNSSEFFEEVPEMFSFLSTPRFFNSSNFFSSVNLFSMPCLITSFQLISGNLDLALSNSSGNDTVIVAIFIPPLNSVNILKSVNIFKSFGLENKLDNK